MYSASAPHLTDAERAAGYEIEDWANNDLGTAVGWWTKGYDSDEPDEQRAALRSELSKRSGGRAAAPPGLAALRSLGGDLARAARADEVPRILRAIEALDGLAVSLEAMKGATATTKLLGRLRRKATDADVRRAADRVVAKWKRIAQRDLADLDGRRPPGGAETAAGS